MFVRWIWQLYSAYLRLKFGVGNASWSKAVFKVSRKDFIHWHSLCFAQEQKERVELNNRNFQLRTDAAMHWEEHVLFLGKRFLHGFNAFRNNRPPLYVAEFCP